MTSVSVDDVRDTLNLAEADIPSVKVLKLIERATVTLGLELSVVIDYQNCTDPQKEAITLLAAIYATCFLTGGSSVGLNFSIGDMTATNSSNLPALDVLKTQLEKILDNLKAPFVGSA